MASSQARATWAGVAPWLAVMPVTTELVRIACVLLLRPAQRTKRYERDAPAVHSPRTNRGPIREVVSVLHADDFVTSSRPQEMSGGSRWLIPIPADQAFVPRGDQRAELLDKPFVRHGVVHHAQVYRGELLDAKRCKVVFDAGASDRGRQRAGPRRQLSGGRRPY